MNPESHLHSDENTEIELNDFFNDKTYKKNHRFSFRYPHVMQHDKMDCGPACLSMISKYYNNDLSIQFWRQRLNTNQLGTTFFDLATTAERFGFRTQPIAVESISELDESLLPVIAVRKYHYVVVYEIGKKSITIGDPGVGIRTISITEFNNGFEQAVLLIKPTETFQNQKGAKTKYSHFFNLAWAFKSEFAVILATSLVIAAFAMLTPFLFQCIFDQALPKNDISLLTIITIAGVFGMICQAVLNYVKAYYIVYVSSKFDFVASSSFIKKLFSLPYEFIAARHTGDFTHRLHEMARLREFLTTHVLQIFLSLINVVLFTFALFFYHPAILSLTLAMCAILVGCTLFFTARLTKAYNNTFVAHSEQESLITDTLKSIPTIKSLSCEVTARWRIEEKITNTLQSRYQFSLTAALIETITESMDQIAKLLIIGFSAYLAIRGNLSTGQVISISMIVSNIVDPFNNLAHSWAGIQEAKSIANRLNDVFLADSETETQSSICSKEGLKKGLLLGDIEFKNVWFRYGGDSNPWALEDVSFKISAGDNLAIVGPSGSGKTTIGQLLAGLYTVTKGSILIDGQDIDHYNKDWLRKRMGFILQEPNLFAGTIAENIAMSSPKVDYQKVEEVSLISNADQFITLKPGTYQYQITSGGLGLSAGEKQRIAFARALYSNPNILVLDEATSAMDGIAEKTILRALKGESRTMINIAHRFSTAIVSDTVLVMNLGRVVATDTHEKLAKTCDLYQKLFNLNQKDQRGLVN